jgi:hypothetical protein
MIRIGACSLKHWTFMRDRYFGAAGLTLEDLRRDYAFVRLGDLVSLMFCAGWTVPQHHAGFTVVHRDQRVIVTPDPFAGRQLAIDVAARELPDRRFGSDGELFDAFRAAPVRVLEGLVAGT